MSHRAVTALAAFALSAYILVVALATESANLGFISGMLIAVSALLVPQGTLQRIASLSLAYPTLAWNLAWDAWEARTDARVLGRRVPVWEYRERMLEEKIDQLQARR
jgi:hypothetical protein